MTAAKAPQSDSLKTVRSSRTFHIGDATLPAATLDPGLYVVATPIGNLADVTLRALAILAGADAILAEDTRISRTLLARYGIESPLSAYHEHNAAEARPRALRRIAEGQALALISDAGTPLISDPGYKLVSEAIEHGFAVTAAPGPSAALAALCVAGLPTDRFYFEGFLPPRSSARRERINALAAVPGSLIFYEAAGRLAETLADLALELGPRPAAVARELTKLHEEVRRGALDKLAADYAAGGAPRGEIVIVVGPVEARPAVSEAALDREIAEQLANSFGQGRRRGDRRQAWTAETAGLCARSGDCRRPAVRSERREADRAPARRASLRPQSGIDRGAALVPQGLHHPGAAVRRVGRRNRPRRETRRLDRLCRSQSAGRSRSRGDRDQRHEAAANRSRRARVAHAKSMGGGPDVAGRRRLRRPRPPSPPRARRV